MMWRENHSQQNFDPIRAKNSTKPSGNTDHANSLMVNSLNMPNDIELTALWRVARTG